MIKIALKPLLKTSSSLLLAALVLTALDISLGKMKPSKIGRASCRERV